MTHAWRRGGGWPCAQVLASEKDPDLAWTRAAALQQAALDAALAPSQPKKAKSKAPGASAPAAPPETVAAENGVSLTCANPRF